MGTSGATQGATAECSRQESSSATTLPATEENHGERSGAVVAADSSSCSSLKTTLTATLRAAESWALFMRAEISSCTQLRCSAGIAPTKLLAMLATKKNKPNGQFLLLPGDAGRRTFFDNTRIDALKGAGVTGIAPQTRELLLQSFGHDAKVGQLRRLREEDLGMLVGGQQLASALFLLLATDGDDGSKVSRFQLPQTLSVELNVRPTDHAPCTNSEAIREGYAKLAGMLLDRAKEDEQCFGPRRVDAVVARWKLFGNAAKEVRQRRRKWPPAQLGGGGVGGRVSDAMRVPLAELAFELFTSAHTTSTITDQLKAERGQQKVPPLKAFRVSRLVLVLVYAPASAADRREVGGGGGGGPSEGVQVSLLSRIPEFLNARSAPMPGHMAAQAVAPPASNREERGDGGAQQPLPRKRQLTLLESLAAGKCQKRL